MKKKIDEYYKSLLSRSFATIAGKADENALIKAALHNKKRHTIVTALTDSDEQNLAIADIITRRFIRLYLQIKAMTKNFQRKAIKTINFVPKSDEDYKLLSDKYKKCEADDRAKRGKLREEILLALGAQQKEKKEYSYSAWQS